MIPGPRMLLVHGLAVTALLTLAACGGGSSPTTPSMPASGNPGPVGATITIGSNGAVSPASVTIAAGQSVTFVNSDSRVHDMASDPHPSHVDCPQMNAVGVITPGQSKNTNAFPSARTCGFHDHSLPDVAALMGRVIIQ